MTVKVFRNTDFGAPTNTSAAGALIAILDACLVNGYGSQTVTSITRTDTTATVTVPTAHLLKDGTFIRISGATQTDYNGDFAITVMGANTFTYQVANSPATPATGTITSKVAPANWTKPFSGTNLAAYKQGAGSNGMYLRIDDIASTSNSLPKARGYENMSDINTGTMGFPTDAQYGTGLNSAMVKSISSATEWCILATEKILYLCSESATGLRGFHVFGDIASYKNGDIYNTVIITNKSGVYVDQQSAFMATFLSSDNADLSGHFMVRASTQSGTAITCGKYSEGMTRLGNAGTYPSPVDNALHIAEITITESNGGRRGTLPGVWNPLHSRPFSTADIILGTGDFTGKKFMAFDFGSNYSGSVGQILLEISNTW
jgi:hypothetical protein